MTVALDIQKILSYLPHRYPFLLVDRVLELTPGKDIVALKNVSINEPFFQGHFPNLPVMPGVLIIEALAQAAGILGFSTAEANQQSLQGQIYFVGIDKAKFRKPVTPGDSLILKVSYQDTKMGMWRFCASASVEGQAVAAADLTCTLR